MKLVHRSLFQVVENNLNICGWRSRYCFIKFPRKYNLINSKDIRQLEFLSRTMSLQKHFLNVLVSPEAVEILGSVLVRLICHNNNESQIIWSEKEAKANGCFKIEVYKHLLFMLIVKKYFVKPRQKRLKQRLVHVSAACFSQLMMIIIEKVYHCKVLMTRSL